MTDFNVSLGRGKNAEQINPNDIKAGIKKEDVQEFASIFEALDKGGQTKGVLEESEVANLKNAINTAKGKNEKLSKHEAKGLLKSLGLKGVNVETFFNFLKKVIGISANIENTSTDENGNTSVLYKSDKNGEQLEIVQDKDGNKSFEVKYQNKGTDNETYQIIKDGQIVGGKDTNGRYRQQPIDGGYVLTYENGEEVTIKDGQVVGGKDSKGAYQRVEMPDNEYRLVRGREVEFYNSDNRVIGGRDKYGNTYTRTYNEDGSYVDQYENTTEFYNKAGKMVKQISGGTISEYEYDANGNKTKVVTKDADGNVTDTYEYEYDSNGNETKEVWKDADGNVTDIYEYEYDANGNKTKMVNKDADGNVTDIYEYEYDANGNMTKKVSKDADGNVTDIYEYEYDANGNMTKKVSKDADGNVTDTYEYEYDANGNKTKVVNKDADGNVTGTDEYVYDANGNKTKMVWKDADGNVIDTYEYEYDKYGKITKEVEKDSDGKVIESTEYSYDEDGKQSKITKDGDGNVISKSARDNRKEWYYFEQDNDGNTTYKYDNDTSSAFAVKDKDGNWKADVREGETFNKTMERLGITEEKLGENYQKAVELFREANKEAASRRGGGWFKVGEMEVNIPKELAEMLDLDNTMSRINIDVEDEVEKWKAR